MLFESKIGWAGLVFILLTTGISGPRRTAIAGTHESTGISTSRVQDTKATVHESIDQQMQQSLSNNGHYRGKVDGVVGLRTRASIRAYQRAEKLPITGVLDVQTASRLGVVGGPEPNVSTIANGGALGVDIDKSGRETGQLKPSAGIEWGNGRRPHRKASAVDDTHRGTK
jgi:hypothetical protein